MEGGNVVTQTEFEKGTGDLFQGKCEILGAAFDSVFLNYRYPGSAALLRGPADRVAGSRTVYQRNFIGAVIIKIQC